MKSKIWKPILDEGRHHRAQIGFILMSTDLASEADFFDMVPEGVGVHITRLKTDDNTTNETLAKHIEHMADAASRIQPDMKPQVISYSCTSGSIIIGEEKVFEEIKRGAPYAKPMSIITGVIEALNELNAKKIVIGTPYLDEINEMEKKYLIKKGFEIIDIQGLNLKTGIEFGQVTPQFIKQFACEINQPNADAVFLSCSGIRAVEVIEEIEQEIQKPVITSNQAQFWACLRKAGVNDKIKGYGQLFLK